MTLTWPLKLISPAELENYNCAALLPDYKGGGKKINSHFHYKTKVYQYSVPAIHL